MLDAEGRVVDFWKIEALAAERRISVRTGCFCNPGASETARGLTVAEMEAVFALGRLPDYEDLRRLLPGKALGAVRASLGIATTRATWIGCSSSSMAWPGGPPTDRRGQGENEKHENRGPNDPNDGNDQPPALRTRTT